MEKSERPIIVTWDFTPVAKNAYMHALNFADIMKKEILLLHIASDKRDLVKKEKKLQEVAEELGKEFIKKPGILVKTGSIFSEIGETATELHAEMIIMGTHGMKGAQKLFGSKALKVVVSSRIPFLVIQDKPVHKRVDNILLPIDFKKENKEKANWIHYLSRNMKVKITIIKSRVKDKGFKRKLRSNMKYIEDFLKMHNVAYDIVTAKGKTSFKEEVVEYAKENSYDMILIMATRNIKFADYLFGAPEQYIMANEYNIPVMCINPRPIKIAGGFRATGSA